MSGSTGSRKGQLVDQHDVQTNLQEGFSPRSPSLEHDRENGEDDDLDGGSPGVPVWPTDTILQIEIVIGCH